MPKPPFLTEACAPILLSYGSLDESAETILEGSLHCLGAEEEAVWSNRAHDS